MKQDYYLVGLIKTVSKMKKKKLYECTNIIEILCLEMNVYVLLKNIFTIETNSPQ